MGFGGCLWGSSIGVQAFLAELVRSCRSEKLPLCIGGILISRGIVVKRIMISLMKDDLSSLMR
jgi:hypothetical protein